MKNTIFPNADHYQIPRALFVGAWKVWFKRFSDHEAWREGIISAASENAKLHQLIEANKRFSLEVINRLMVPWFYRDKSQVSEAFFLMNQDMLKRVKSEDDPEAELVRLSDQALDYWDGLTFLEQDLFTAYAEARIQADIETPSQEPVVIDDHGLEVIGEDIYPPVVPPKDATDEQFAQAIVAWIEEDPFTPMYQRLPVGEAVSSWHDRLEAFFWPKPRNGLMQVSHSADGLMYRAEILARGIEENSVRDGSEWDSNDTAWPLAALKWPWCLRGLAPPSCALVLGQRSPPGNKETPIAAHARASARRVVGSLDRPLPWQEFPLSRVL